VILVPPSGLCVLQWSTPKLLAHIAAVLELPGARLAFGGAALTGHRIPAVYGAIQPTAVFVPLESLLASEEAYQLATTEVFGPFQVRTRDHHRGAARGGRATARAQPCLPGLLLRR
jgi:hypothetical protein